MLIFSKTSIQSSVFDLIDVFIFPDKDVKKTYQNNKNEKCFLFQNLTETDSTSVFFNFVSTPSTCLIHAEKAIDVIFDVLIKSKILERLNFSENFWERFCVQNKSLQNQVGLSEIENINNVNVLTIAINSNKYFEKYIFFFSVNKKYPKNRFWSIFREISNIAWILFW